MKSSLNVANQPVSITSAGTISKITAQGDQSLFKLELTADLSDLQQNITEILRSKFDRLPRCGERIAVQWATLTAEIPASVAVAQLHLERWGCLPPLGAESPTELAEGGGKVTLKLTPVEENGALQLVADEQRVDADAFVGDILRSSLGDALRDEVAQLFLSALQAGIKETLPAAAQDNATIQKAEFFEGGGLHVVLRGSLRISDDHVKVLADQLKGHLATQGGLQQ